jgi:hypothetical protein
MPHGTVVELALGIRKESGRNQECIKVATARFIRFNALAGTNTG